MRIDAVVPEEFLEVVGVHLSSSGCGEYPCGVGARACEGVLQYLHSHVGEWRVVVLVVLDIRGGDAPEPVISVELVRGGFPQFTGEGPKEEIVDSDRVSADAATILPPVPLVIPML